jgi:hypothetical protein
MAMEQIYIHAKSRAHTQNKEPLEHKGNKSTLEWSIDIDIDLSDLDLGLKLRLRIQRDEIRICRMLHHLADWSSSVVRGAS